MLSCQAGISENSPVVLYPKAPATLVLKENQLIFKALRPYSIHLEPEHLKSANNGFMQHREM